MKGSGKLFALTAVTFAILVSCGGGEGGTGGTGVSIRAESLTEIPKGATSCASGCFTFTGRTSSFAVDPSGNVWFYAKGLTEIPKGEMSCASDCLAFSLSGDLIGDLIETVGADKFGNIWVAGLNSAGGGVVVKIPAGFTSCVSGCTTFTGAGISGFLRITVDASGNVWVLNNPGPGGISSVTEIPAGAASCLAECITFAGAGISQPNGVAVDGSGNAWVSNFSSITEISKGAAADCSSGCTNFTGGGILSPNGIAVDGSGNVWVANQGSVTEIPAGSNSCPEVCRVFTLGVFTVPTQIAIDPSGNVWIANAPNPP